VIFVYTKKIDIAFVICFGKWLSKKRLEEAVVDGAEDAAKLRLADGFAEMHCAAFRI